MKYCRKKIECCAADNDANEVEEVVNDVKSVINGKLNEINPVGFNFS